MKTFASVLVAVLPLLALAGNGVAEETDFSDLEHRLAVLESQLSDQQSLLLASHCASDVGCSSDLCGSGCCCGTQGGQWSAEVQFSFLRSHIVETATTKFAEEFELAPRFILGYENSQGQGARVRYWHYGHYVDNNLNPGNGIRTQLDVVDLEATSRFSGCRTDVVLSGGVRFGHFEFTEFNPIPLTEDLLGLTAAVEAESLICCNCNRDWSFVYGGRLSILAGDLQQQTIFEIRDDNWRVYEIHAGAEYGCCRCGYDMYCRFMFEVQNWHLDSFNVDSIGFVGPSFQLGVGF